MLEILRKHSRHWLIAVIIGAIVVVFIFWGIGGVQSPQSQEIARVYGQPIPITTYLQYLTFLEKKARFRRNLTEEDIKALREQAPDTLINLVLLTHTAHRLGYQVSDQEVQAAILLDPDFQHQGAFDPRLYEFFIGRGRNRQGEKLEYERWVRQQVLAAKVAEAVTAFAKVSELELQEYFRLAQEAVQVDYLVVSPEAFLARVQPSEADLKAYYQKHQGEFRVPDKVKVRYVLCRSQDFLSRVEVSPKSLEIFLEEHRDVLQRPKVIKVREIFLAWPPKATPSDRQKLEKKAQELMQQLLQGRDFAQLAQAFSQDDKGRQAGGALGEVQRGQKPPTWDRVAFTLAEGQVGLARTDRGLHIIKLEAIQAREPLPDGEAKAKALEKMKEIRSRDLAQDEAKRLLAATASTDFPEVVRKNRLTLKETPMISQTDPIPELGAVRAFNDEAFKLKPQEAGLAEVPQGFVVMQLLERQAARVPPFPEVQERVRQAVARQEANKMAAASAEGLLARLRQGEPLAKVAAQASLPIRASGFFTRPQGFLEQPLAEPLTTAAFMLTASHPYPPKPVAWQGKYYLLAFKGRRLPSPEDFQKARDHFERRLLEEKRRLLLEAWLKEEWQRAQVTKSKQPS